MAMVEVVIDSLGSSGDGVGRLPNGEVVFVAGGLPGDKLSVSLGERRKKVQHATIRSIVEPSPWSTKYAKTSAASPLPTACHLNDILSPTSSETASFDTIYGP